MLKSRVRISRVLSQFNKISRCWSSSVAETEWKNAKPYSEIPGPSTFGMIKHFGPGGKYNNLNAIELMSTFQKDYGQIAKLPGFFGKRDLLFLFDPNDFELVFRTEGKYPVRRGLDTLEYFRSVYRKDWFEKNIGLVPR